ncbi:hypothetical protein [Pontibacter chitinilyticus]|uniref:hypothetical protein n=1 Tax=Pontibacter chitinilyticus TaxID=2674989 RepID=UPI003219AC42
MKDIAKLTLIAGMLMAFTACGDQEHNTIEGETDAVDNSQGNNIETDTSITQDPDTTTYHDMTL